MGCLQFIENVEWSCVLTVRSLSVTLKTTLEGVFQDKDGDPNKDYCV
jgi:hypothetical protein